MSRVEADKSIFFCLFKAKSTQLIIAAYNSCASCCYRFIRPSFIWSILERRCPTEILSLALLISKLGRAYSRWQLPVLRWTVRLDWDCRGSYWLCLLGDFGRFQGKIELGGVNWRSMYFLRCRCQLVCYQVDFNLLVRLSLYRWRR